MSTLSTELRPSCLEDFIGNEKIKENLKKQVESGRIPTAVLFVGATGTGKTTFANIFARMVQGDIGTYEAIDIVEVNCGSDGGVDEMRALAEASAYRPLSGVKKVFLLNEAQKLTDAAQQALLIPTEVQDSSSIWIFTTTDAEKIRPDLKGRCLRFDLKPLTPPQVGVLVCRGMGQTWPDNVDHELVDYLVKSGVTAPRQILMAVEKRLAGAEVADCVTREAAYEPLYKEVAQEVIRGNWDATRALLEQIKTTDYKGLQAVLGAYMGSALLKLPIGPRADAISGCLISLGNAGFADGVAYQALKGALYRCSKAINQSK